MYADLTIRNKSLLKRFSHGSRVRIGLELLEPVSDDRILDYGTGDGLFLSRIRSANKSCRVVGYEPMPEILEGLKGSSVEIVNDTSGFAGTFNKICCLEVLEHLTEAGQRREIEEMKRLLADGGQIIVSVPIEVGISSLLKNVARFLLHQSHGNTTFKTILCSLLGVRFHRGEAEYIHSHMGFYYRDLERLLSASGLKISKKVFSPIPVLGRMVNSQVFVVLKRGSAQE